MFTLARRCAIAASLIPCVAGATPLAAQAPKAVPGQPYQYWDVLEADGAARKVYFRNDGAAPIKITELVILKCENTRQLCGTYPANLVIAPGKTVVAFKSEQLDKKLGWRFAYSFHTHVEGQPVMLPGSQTVTMIGAPGAGQTVMLQTVAVDSLAPAVPAYHEGATCGTVRPPDLPPGHRALLMIFGTATQPTARTVMVRLDANGSAYEYSETRREIGDTSANPRQSSISLDFVRQSAMLRNSGGGNPTTMFRAIGPTLLTAASLDRPGEMIARVVQECGAAR